MRKLLIVDPTLVSLEGHSYNYDRAIFGAAQGKFDEVVLYADLAFRDTSVQPIACRPILNRLPINALKRWVSALHHPFKRMPGQSAAIPSNARDVPKVWGEMIRLGKVLRARDLEASVRSIIAEQGSAGDELHLFFQHTRVDELLVADRLRRRTPPGKVHLHLVLRHSPELCNARYFGNSEFASLLKGIALSSSPRVHFLTDSERLSAEYRALGLGKVGTLPVPILLPEEEPAAADPVRVDVSFLGSSRVEKGFCELPALVARLPREAGGRVVRAVVQMTRDSTDPRVRATVAELRRLQEALPQGALELRESPVPMTVYYGWVRAAGVVAFPYLSDKYNASTSGIFVEAICFGVPVLVPSNSWMSDVVTETERAHGLRIGETFATLDEIPTLAAHMAEGIGRYRADVRRFSKLWRRTHNPAACVEALLANAA
jgi:hypothetical protein